MTGFAVQHGQKPYFLPVKLQLAGYLQSNNASSRMTQQMVRACRLYAADVFDITFRQAGGGKG